MLETRDLPLRSQTDAVNGLQGGAGCPRLGRPFTVTTPFEHPPLQPDHHDEAPRRPAVHPLRQARVPDPRSQLAEQRHRAEPLGHRGAGGPSLRATGGEVQRQADDSPVAVNAGEQLFLRRVAVRKVAALAQLELPEESAGGLQLVHCEVRGSAGGAGRGGVNLGGVGELDEGAQGQLRGPHLGLLLGGPSALEAEAADLDGHGEHRGVRGARLRRHLVPRTGPQLVQLHQRVLASRRPGRSLAGRVALVEPLPLGGPRPALGESRAEGRRAIPPQQLAVELAAIITVLFHLQTARTWWRWKSRRGKIDMKAKK